MASATEHPVASKRKTTDLTVALAGNPNSGKTTLFNALTGLRQKVANYPGVTVEKKTGRCRLSGDKLAQIIDLPGAYSLISDAPDEKIAMEVLRGLRSETPAPDVVVVVVDASNLQRNLYFVSQLIELHRPLVVALNMMDVARRRGVVISAEKLEQLLGVPVIPVVAHKGQGVAELKEAILRARVAPEPHWTLPAEMKEELAGLGVQLRDLAQTNGHSHAIAERLLVGDRASDLQQFSKNETIRRSVDKAHKRLAAAGIDPMQADIEAHYHWIESVATATVSRTEAAKRRKPLTDRVDSILIHKFWGLLIFTAIMATIFVAIFWIAKPVMDATNGGITFVGEWMTSFLPDGPIKSMLNDGAIAGAGAVIGFVPQIALLFMFLAILEDSGYLARAAFLMDRLLSRVGLHGKSFIPLLSSFACAIPGIMATRTIENRRDRLATILIAPFMSCSARLPVYSLLISTLFAPRYQGQPLKSALVQAGIMLGCYALGIFAAVGTAWVFKRSLLKGKASSFILELPSYKLPQVSQVAREVFRNAGEFVWKAGTVIVAFSVVLWALSYYPRYNAPEGMSEEAAAAVQQEQSFSGRIGHFMEPAIRPLGFDWKMGVGLLSAFGARETFVSTMAVQYAMGAEEEDTTPLSEAMLKDRYPNGKPVWTPLVGISLLVFFVLALQCTSTIAIARRETGGWGWPIFMLVYANVLAYLGSLAVYQIGTYLGYA